MLNPSKIGILEVGDERAVGNPDEKNREHGEIPLFEMWWVK